MGPYLLGILLGVWPAPALGRGTHHGVSHASHPATHAAVQAGAGASRDARARIHRSAAAKASFRAAHPCPSTGRTKGACPGYEVDHVVPLACGGRDAAGNMQWLTTAANRSKGSGGCRTRR